MLRLWLTRVLCVLIAFWAVFWKCSWYSLEDILAIDLIPEVFRETLPDCFVVDGRADRVKPGADKIGVSSDSLEESSESSEGSKARVLRRIIKALNGSRGAIHSWYSTQQPQAFLAHYFGRHQADQVPQFLRSSPNAQPRRTQSRTETQAETFGASVWK